MREDPKLYEEVPCISIMFGTKTDPLSFHSTIQVFGNKSVPGQATQ